METPFIVAFQTCDRIDLTRRTLESFSRHHPVNDWLKYYADDSSDDQESMCRYVESHGFRPMVINRGKRGWIYKTLSDLVDGINREVGGHGTMLYLQNDFEFLRPIPMKAVEALFENKSIGWIRMAGAVKDVYTREMMPEYWCKGIVPLELPTKWKAGEVEGETVEIGKGIFCHNPAVIGRMSLMAQFIIGTMNETSQAKRAATTDFLSARFTNNVTTHIGAGHPTPNKKS